MADSPAALLTSEAKLLTVVLRPGEQVHVEVRGEHFSHLNEEEKGQQLHTLILQAAGHARDEASSFQEGEWGNFIAPINNGSLYDDVVFDTAIYLESEDRLRIVTSFGKPMGHATALGKALLLVGDVLEATSKHFPAPPAPTPVGPEAYANRF